MVGFWKDRRGNFVRAQQINVLGFVNHTGL